MPYVEGITMRSGGTDMVELVCESSDMCKVSSWSCGIWLMVVLRWV